MKYSKEWVVTSLFLQSHMFNIATPVPALVLPQAWPSDLVVHEAKHCLMNWPSFVWSTPQKLEGKCNRLSQRAQQQLNWSWRFSISSWSLCLPVWFCGCWIDREQSRQCRRGFSYCCVPLNNWVQTGYRQEDARKVHQYSWITDEEKENKMQVTNGRNKKLSWK